MRNLVESAASQTTNRPDIPTEGRILCSSSFLQKSAAVCCATRSLWKIAATTAIKQLGRFHELRTRMRYSESDRIPI